MGIAEWIGLCALGLGVIALPTVLQMFWGRSDISFEFERFENAGGSLLLVHLYNRPVGNSILLRLRVKREEAYFKVVVKINDISGNQILRYPEPKLSSGRDQFHLPASHSPITIQLVSADNNGARIYFDVDPREHHDLLPGTYEALISAWVAETIFFAKKTFVVTANPRDSYWADS